MKRFLLLLLLLFSLSKLYSIENSDYTKVIASAKKGFLEYLEKIPQGCESLYGFNSKIEFTKASCEMPYQVVTITSDFYSNPISSVKSSLLYTDQWIVPISVDGEFRSLLTVEKINNEYKVVALGSASMAYELGQQSIVNSSNQHFGLLFRIYQYKSDFILTSKDDNSNKLLVYPLTSAIIWLQKPYKGYDLEQILRIAYDGKF